MEVMYRQHPIYTTLEIGDDGTVSTINDEGERLFIIPSDSGSSTKYKAIWRFYKLLYVHRLVYETFRGPIPPGYQINHMDGNGFNNHISNLQACTVSENMLHSYRELGRMKPIGNKIGPAKKELWKVHGDIITYFDSYASASRELGIPSNTIRHRTAKGIIKDGFYFTHINPNEGNS